MRAVLLLLCSLALSSTTSAQDETTRVFVFAGQSNMVGSDSHVEDVQRFPPFAGLEQPQPDVRFSYVLGREHKTRSEGWVDLQPVDGLIGPELSFARELTRHVDAPLAIIKCAAGGTHLGGDWNPDEPGGFEMYPLLLEQVRSSLAELERQGVAYRIEGFVWHQGENDMFDEGYMKGYGANLRNFVASVRRDLECPELRFFVGELCTKTIWGMDLRPRMHAISVGQKEVAAADPLVDYVRTSHIGVEVGQPVGLHYHYGTLGQLEHGVEYARAYLRSLGVAPDSSTSLETWPFEEGQTVRLFILAGHRNMEGERAFVQELASSTSGAKLLERDARVPFKYSTGGGFKVSDGWEALGPAGSYDTFGPELSFGATLRAELDAPIAIAKFTHSGSQILDWTPEGSVATTRNLYPAFLAFVREAVAELEARGHAVELAGVLYHVGENDMSFAPFRREAPARLRAILRQLRQDLGLPTLRWFLSQQPPTDHESLNAIDVTAGLEQLAAEDPHCVHVKVFDLPPQDRALVLDTAGIVELGGRLARAWLPVEADLFDFSRRPADGVQLVGDSGHTMIAESDGPSRWKFSDGVLTASPAWDSVVTPGSYQDFRMHLEFSVNAAENEDREANGNSGVYIQQRYEVQILDSFGVAADDYEDWDCGSLYRLKRPDRPACRPAGAWQSYDIVFRAARFDGERKVENARVTVFQNEQLIHDDVSLPRKTGAGRAEGPDARPIKLQGHHNEVRFRNVWIEPLTIEAMPRVPDDDPRRAGSLRMGAPTMTLPRPGEVFHVEGCAAFVIEPPESARLEGPMPWVWYAPTLRGLPGELETWMFDRLLAAGIAIAGIDVGESYGSPKGRASYQALYRFLTTKRGYARKPALLARSRGGLMLYGWAVEHPESVGGIAGIYPVCDLASYPGVARAAPAFEMTADELDAQLDAHNPIDRLATLAEAKVPVLHIHGDQDATVPLSSNSAELGKRYAALGGPVEVSVIEGRGHDLWEGWFQSEQLTDFVIARALAGRLAQPEAASEVRWHGHRRLDFVVSGKPARLVIPEHPAPGRPWVWRARFPDFHTGSDLILLERGFHVAFVDTGGMLGGPKAMAIWDDFYETLRAEHGLAARPALEGVSRGGLFIYHWAARHPERVACIYADTAVCDIKSWPLGRGAGRGHAATWQHLLGELELTHEQAMAYPLDPIDLLEPIAAAGIPILSIVSLNDQIVPPSENTFVLAERYRALGGDIRVMEVEEGTAESSGHHFPHPDPLRPADFIERHACACPDPDGYLSLRGALENCRARFEDEGRGRVAFLGGSITHNPGWRDAVCDYLRARFPATEFDFVAAGVPSMGSTPGAFRLARDVFGRGPVDLLFQEAAVNDSTNGRSAIEMTRGVEGIVRHARTLNPAVDVVLLHFVDPDKMARYRAGEVPLVIRQHEAVAAHHGVSTLHLAREVTERIDAGQFTWKDDFKDLHPSPFGQRLYAASLRRLLSACWDEPLPDGRSIVAHSMPEPLDPFSYDAGELAGPEQARDLEGIALVLDCDPRAGGVGGGVRPGFVNVPMLVGTEPGASLSFTFEGRAVGVWVAAGPDAGTIEHRIDGGAWRSQDLFTRWSGGLHLPWVYVLAAELDGGAHELELRIAETKNPRSKGHAFRAAHFVVNR